MNILAFDLGGSAMKSGIVDESYQVTKKRTYIMDGVSRENKHAEDDIVLYGIRDADSFADTIVRIMKDLDEPVDGIAFSYNCPVNHYTGETYPGGMAQRFLNNINFPELFLGRCDVPVSVAKDSNCMLLAEVEAGSLKGMKNALAVGLGTGIAMGTLINGEVYLGHRCASGEASTIIVDYEHPEIPLAGHTGIWGLFEKLAPVIGKQPHEINGYSAFQAITSGDKDIVDAFMDYVYKVAVMLTNFTYILAPEAIAIGGGIAAQPLLIDSIQKEFTKIREQYAGVYTSEPKIVQCKFLNDSNLIGAAIAFQRYSNK